MSGYFSICLFLALTATGLSQSAEEENNSGKYQGDIMLTNEDQVALEVLSNKNDLNSPQNAVVRNPRSLWPDGVVPYVLDSSLNSQARTAIQQAISTYATQSCIRFVQRTNERDYVRFYPGSGCFSFIGRTGGPQDISIGRGCEFEGIVIHEMFHALGRWHEQSRQDRDTFVRILTENIQSGRESNFEITNPAFATTQGVPYDIRSIMHYGSTAFSRNGQPTILPRDSRIDRGQLGQRTDLTSSDLEHIKALYCSGNDVSSWASWASWSSCSRTCNGGIRTRRRQCTGGTACEGNNVQNELCNQQSCPVPSSWGAWTSWGACSATCGGGRQRRTRTCQGGNNCVGSTSQFRDCGTNQCPEPASWGSWGSWSSCSSTCQGGLRQRRRTCRNGNTCSGADFENQSCNRNIPCVPNPNNGEWSSWSTCTTQCGGGTRFRTRMCGTQNCNTEEESCNTQDCEPEPELRGIRYRGCWYFNNRNRRVGSLEGTTPKLSDNALTRQNPVSKCGAVAVEGRSYAFFGITLGYCISGSNNLRDYQWVRSNLCRDGRGGYSRGYFIMDVYEITNGNSFRDSVASVEAVTTAAPPETTSQDTGSGSANSLNRASGMTSNVSVVIGMMFIVCFALIMY